MAQNFSAGDPNVNLQDVMVNLQKANLSFQQMVQVRQSPGQCLPGNHEHAGVMSAAYGKDARAIVFVGWPVTVAFVCPAPRALRSRSTFMI